MIDSNFYQKIGDSDIERLYSGELSAEEILHIIETNRSDLPHIDQLETTNNCNMSCQMCPRTEHMTRAIVPSMNRDIFKAVVDELSEVEEEKRLRGISIEGFETNPPTSLLWDGSVHDVFDLRLHHFGAPLLDAQIVDRVAYIGEKGSFGAQMSETVINLRIDKVRALFQHGLRRLIIAVDAVDTSSFRKIRGRNVDFQKAVIQKVREVMKIKEETGSNTRIDVQVIDLKDTSVSHFEHMWHEEGVHVLRKSFFPYPDVSNEVGNISTEFSADCLLPFTSMVVLADGRVVPCCADYNGEEVIGDVKKQSLTDIWNGSKFRAFRENFVKSSFEEDSLCRRCGAYPFSTLK